MTQRQQRVGRLLKAVVSEILQTEINDPRLGFVTVTEAEPSVDLRSARVFISVLGTPEEERSTLEALKGAAGFIRGEVARRVTLRRIPEIHFRLDSGARRASRIHELLKEVNQDSHFDEI